LGEIGLPQAEGITDSNETGLPSPDTTSPYSLALEYPRADSESLIDEAALRKYTEDTFDFHLVRRPQIEARLRLDPDQTISNLSPLELLDKYWKANNFQPQDVEALNTLARTIIGTAADGED